MLQEKWPGEPTSRVAEGGRSLRPPPLSSLTPFFSVALGDEHSTHRAVAAAVTVQHESLQRSGRHHTVNTGDTVPDSSFESISSSASDAILPTSSCRRRQRSIPQSRRRREAVKFPAEHVPVDVQVRERRSLPPHPPPPPSAEFIPL